MHIVPSPSMGKVRMGVKDCIKSFLSPTPAPTGNARTFNSWNRKCETDIHRSPLRNESRDLTQIHAGNRAFFIAGKPVAGVRYIHHVRFRRLLMLLRFPVNDVGIVCTAISVNFPFDEPACLLIQPDRTSSADFQQMLLGNTLRQPVADYVFVHASHPPILSILSIDVSPSSPNTDTAARPSAPRSTSARRCPAPPPARLAARRRSPYLRARPGPE